MLVRNISVNACEKNVSKYIYFLIFFQIFFIFYYIYIIYKLVRTLSKYLGKSATKLLLDYIYIELSM